MAKDTGFIDVGDGERLAWEASGDGPAVLLIHGGSTDRHMWDAQVQALQASYRVITYDIRGIGESTRPGAHYRMSDDAFAVLDEAGADTAAIVGFSIGSWITLDAAVRDPGRVTAFSVTGVVPWNSAERDRYAAARQDLTRRLEPREEAQRRGDLAAAIGYDLDVWAATHTGAAREALEQRCTRAAYFYEHRESADEWHGDLPPIDDAALAALTTPSLVIAGEQDVELVQLASTRLITVLRHSRLLRVPDADHFVGLAQPDILNRALLEFLDSNRL